MKLQSVTLKRILSLVMVFAMILTLVPNVALAAGTPEKLYLEPNSNWTKDNARFAAYFFGNGEKWLSMTDPEGDGIYEVTVPSGYPSVIFCRMNPGTTANNWSNKWNQTADLTVPTNGTNCYTVKNGTWDKGGGTWSVYAGVRSPYTIVGTISPAGWSPANGEKLVYDEAKGLFVYTYTNVAAGSYEFKVTNGTWNAAWPANNYALTVAEDGSTVTVSFNGVTKTITTKVVKEYAVSYDLTHVTSSNTATKVVKGEAYTTTLTAEEGYDLPETVTVTMGGTAVDGAYNASTGVITIASVTGDIAITAVGALKFYDVTFNGTNVTSNGEASVNHGATYTATLTAADGYTLPETVTVIMGGNAVEHTYNASTGALSVANVTGALSITAEGVKDKTILYLKPGVWVKDNARFAAYFFNNGTGKNEWISMVDSDGDGVYEVELPDGYPNVIFGRMNPGSAVNSWDTKWNQTNDLTVPTDDNTCYTISGWGSDKSPGSWGKYTYVEPLYTIAGTISAAGWSPENGEKLADADKDGIYTYTYTNVAAGDYAFKVTNGTWDAAWPSNDYKLNVAENGSTVTVSFNASAKTVSVEVVAPEKVNVTFDGTNVASSNAATKVVKGEAYTTTLTAEEGYTLPETVTVTVGGAAVTGFTYENGILTIPASLVTGDIVITATGVVIPVEPETMTIYFENNWSWPDAKIYWWGSVTGTNPGWPGLTMTYVDTTENGADRYSIEVPADVTGILFNGTGGYGAEQSADISSGWYDGICYYMTYDGATNTKPAGSYKYEPIAKSFAVTLNGTNVTVTGETTVKEGSAYTATLTAVEGYNLPATVTVTMGGAEADHTYNAETGVITVANVTGDIVITAAGVEIPPEPETMTVYFRNDWLWTNVSVHYWGSASEPDTSWPGAAMTKVGSDSGYDVYSAEIPADVDGFLFNGIKNDGSGNRDQTPNITDGRDGDAYYIHWDGENKVSKFAYTPGGAGGEDAYYLQGYLNNADYYGSEYKFENGTLTVQFTADSYVYLKDGNNANYKFSAYCQDTTGTLTTGGTEKMFVPGNVELTFTVTENGDGSLTLSYVQGGSGGGEGAGDTYEVTFHFANTLNWGTVNLYTWTGSGTQQTGAWPGTAVTADGSGYYTYTVSYEAATNEGLNFIFNNGSSQTVDLKVEASEFTDKKAEVWVVLTTKDGEGKYNAAILADPSKIVVSPVVDEDTVTFNYGGDAASVAVAGTFNNWSTTATPMTKNADGVWTATVSGLVAGNYKYKFVVNGTEWILDPMNSNTEKDQDENENSVFYILSGSGVEDDNTVTIRIHYKRNDGKYDGWNLWVWGSNMGGHRVDFDSADADGAKVATIVLDDARAHQSISFKERLSVEGNEWKDQASSDRFIDLATVVSGTIDYYIASGSCVYGDDVIRKNKVSSVAVDYDNNAVVVTTVQAVANPETAFVLKKGDDVIPVTIQAVGSKYSLILPSGDPLNLKELYKYRVMFEGAPYSIAVDAAYASDQFAAEFTYTGNDLGAAYTSGSTTFRVWAPTAEAVSVKLYSTGSDAETGAAELGTYPMTSDVNGTWIVTINGDLLNIYYTYIVSVGGETVEANDPYSRATGVNGKRSMVIDLDRTDPDGWAGDGNPNPVTSQTDAIIYELHVRDFSIDESSGVSEANRGKYLAFTENGTTVNGAGTTSTGIDYLKQLGFTHLHLLPVYDYASVDETTCSNFNWGYDPQNYNVPEGSYSRNPYDGNVRVNEFKQMVQALHNSGISVVMDVVYNHVYDASTFSFNQIVPGYFSRVASNTSGCGNDTASEREMVRKYIVESVLYWTQEYHIDGFRFDLVGLIDTETINQIVTEVHAIRPDVIFYGEGWNMDSTNKEPGTEMAKQGNASKVPGFAFFSDSMRNNLGGNNEGTATGFASGAGNGGSMVSEWKGNPWWTNNPQQVVQYASCHDNYTLADKIVLSTGRSTVDSTVIKMNNLAAAFYMTSQGVPFIHAGEELLREKLNADGSRNHNSYNSPDSVNHIDWTDVEKYASTSAYYQGLIALRKAHPALRYSTAALVDANVQTREASANLIALRIDGYGAGDDDIFAIFNAASSAQTVSLPEGQWTIYVQGDLAGTTALGTASGSISVGGISATVLTKADEGKDEKEPLGASSEKTLYFSNNKHWNQVYAYAWTDNGETILLGAWPGTAMTYVETNDYGEDIYAITLPASATGVEGVIFHNNEGEQTVDIEPGVDGTGYYCTDKNDENKYQAGTYTYRAPILGDADEYFLHGYINGADYVGDGYKFVSGKLTTTFSADSYVYVVNGDASATYMTDGYKGFVDSVEMLDTAKHTLTGQQWDKLLIPGGTEVTLTLTVNNDNTVTLSYTAASAGVEDTSGIQKGLTLHCWNWSFAEIEKNIPLIAQLGYTAIQTSPVQPLKEATNLPGHSVGGNWWVYYQPVDFTITTDSGNALGTKDDLVSMIETAHLYGVQVIVDVVANHLGNKTGNDLADAIPEYLRKAEYWHDITVNTTDYTSRFDMTQHCMGGLPDLNTANADVQGYVLKFLKECVDAGVDGFRFDAAKHIETPKDDTTFASDFWTVVVDGAEDYAQTTYGKDLYIYGEVLDDPAIAISAYTRYMAVTDNGWSNHLRSMVAAGNAGMVGGYYKSAPASQLVLWAESHDTFTTDDRNQSSAGVSEADILKTWALVAARKDAMGLFFARPESLNQAVGVASVTGWAAEAVGIINAFHNHFDGRNEAVANENGISYVVRGTDGAVLVQVSQAATVADEIDIAANGLEDGTYVDQISGNLFTVTNGRISGQIGTSGIAVLSKNALPATTYNVTVVPAAGGTVTADRASAKVSDTVYVTAAADEGKELDAIVVTTAAGDQVDVLRDGDRYLFIMPAADVTVTATFKAVVQDPEKFDVVLKVGQGGKAELDKESAAAGETVTVTVTPDEDKELHELTATDAAGKAVALKALGSGKYSFTQPEGGVTVQVSFKAKPATPPTGDNSLLGLWLMLATVSAAAFVALVLDRRKKTC